MKNYISRGITLKFKNITLVQINSGDMIQYSNNLAIALTDIKPDETGLIDIEGVFLLPKEAEQFEPGMDLYVNLTTKKLQTTGTMWYAGLCVSSETVQISDTHCLLKIGY